MGDCSPWFHPDRAEVPEEEITLLTKDPGADPHWFPPFYENRSSFSLINIFLLSKLNKLKSGQYPV